jgi:signal transduction histidine kinase
MSGPSKADGGFRISSGTFGLDSLLRRMPIRGRILSIAGLNTAVVVLLALLVIDGAGGLRNAWNDLVLVRSSEKLLTSIETESGRLQSLIHRYFTQPSPDVLEEIERRRRTLTALLSNTDVVDDTLEDSLKRMSANTERLLAAFDQLRKARVEISETYENRVLKAAREISGLYAIMESTISGSTDALVKPPLGRSRESFSAALVAANSYYLSNSANSAQEVLNGLDTIERTLPVMIDLATNDLQRAVLNALGQRVGELRTSMQALTGLFDKQAVILRDSVDRSQAEMTATTTALTERIREVESQVQSRLDQNLNSVYWKIAIIAISFSLLIAIIASAIAASVNRPLTELMHSMSAIVGNKLDQKVSGDDARDEIGDMARAIEVFRQNAIAKLKAEEELRTAKDSAEAALANLQAAQNSLIEAEKLAALGGLVAGVAHEVNNPVGISLTVASTLERRSEDFMKEVTSGDLRRSRLNEFLSTTLDASRQLSANLHRAGELIQSFKQVAVDRSHTEARVFDLKEATQQIIASLRPGLAKRKLDLSLECPDGISMNSYPGPYGQVLTNLFINSVTHGFRDDREGSIAIKIAELGDKYVSIEFADTGWGMSEDVRKHAFEPFYTTLRGQGGTGLGLHIVYNIVTQKLGGRIELSTRAGEGSTFHIVLPREIQSEDAPSVIAKKGPQ